MDDFAKGSASLVGGPPGLAERPGRRRSPGRAGRRRLWAARRAEAEFLVCLAADGAVLDSLRPLNDLAAGPLFASSFARAASRERMEELWRRVSLGSRLRGANRFRQISGALRLGLRDPVLAPSLNGARSLADALDAWLAESGDPDLEALKDALRARKANPRLAKVGDWAKAVDEKAAGLENPKAFPGAGRAIAALRGRAELVALGGDSPFTGRLAWERAGLGDSASLFASARALEGEGSVASLCEGRYTAEDILVVGASLSELALARALGASFYPILAGREDESWAAFEDDFLPRFIRREPVAPPLAGFLSTLAPLRPRP